MKYSKSTVINKTLPETAELLINKDNNKHWQEGLLDITLLEGESNEVGARYQLTFQMGKREMKMLETITEKNFPHSITYEYKADAMWNKLKMELEAIDAFRTKVTSISEFKGQNFMMKAMLFLAPGMFKKQTQKYLVAFKDFAENGTSVSE